RRKQIEKELAALKEDSSGRKARWQAEKEAIGKIRKLKEQIEQLRAEEQKYERTGEFAKVAEIRYGKIAAAERDLQQAQERFAAVQKDAPMLKEEVDEEDIAKLVSKWTGIPTGRLLEAEAEKLVHMEERLRLRVVGQDDALGRVSNAVRRSRAGLSDAKRPIGSFIFLDLTDGKGRTVDFRNTVLVMTSNVGSAAIFELSNKDAELTRREATEALRASFRPEFINRIDEIVTFNPLGKEHLERIVGLLLKNVEKLLADRQITLELTPAAKELLLQQGYEPAYGARPLRRTIQRLLQDPLALQILEGAILPGDHVRVDRHGQKDAMRFERAP